MEEEALRLAAAGFAVMPVGAATKKPMRGSHGPYDASTEPDRVRALFKDRPTVAVAIATGTISSTPDGRALVVVDVDPRKGGVEGLAAAERALGPLPATKRASTPRDGWHYYLRAPAGADVRNSADEIAPGIDVRGEGGYAACPPGRGREWTHNPPLAELPAAWLKAAGTRRPKSRSRPAPTAAPQTLREALAATQAAGGDYLRTLAPERYFDLLTGAHPGPDGKLRCPLPGHEDRTPSCMVYADGWWCFGCSRGGGIYELAAHLVGAPCPLRGAAFLAVQGAVLDTLETRAGATP